MLTLMLLMKKNLNIFVFNKKVVVPPNIFYLYKADSKSSRRKEPVRKNPILALQYIERL